MSERPLCTARDCAQALEGTEYVLVMERPDSGRVLYQCPQCGELSVVVYPASEVSV